MEFWITLLIMLPVLALLGVGSVVFQMVHRLSRPGAGIRPVAREDCPEDFARASELEAWASSRGFVFSGAFRFDVATSLFVAAWQRPGRSEYLLEYQSPHLTHYDFVSLFADEHALTTASTKDSLFLPQPIGLFVQCFPGVELDGLLKRHEDAKVYLCREYQLTESFQEAPIHELVNRAIARQMQYVRSIPFWPLRSPWWYFVNRETLKGRPVDVLYPPNTDQDVSKAA